MSSLGPCAGLEGGGSPDPRRVRPSALLFPLLILSLAGCDGATPEIDAGEPDDAGDCPALSCGDECVDPSSDPRHCGGCDVACGAGEVCADGACELSCPEGQDACDGGCHDLAASPAHCGACGVTCDAGEVCSEGACATSCAADLTDCSGACRDLATDRASCGACGVTCDAGEICADGACAPSCGAGLTVCDDACVDARSDRAHCGACDVACDAGEACLDGACGVLCPSGQLECGGRCVDPTADPSHCGACDVACDADERCDAGACAPRCATGTFCGGACVDLGSDPTHCGACGNVCPAGAVCDAGVCAASCGAGLTNCGGACVSLDHDPDHCGGCDSVCPGAAGASGLCMAGSCRAVCDPGFGDCNADLTADGCETSIATAPTDCGACGLSCSVSNGAAGCTSGGCVVATCDTGFGDCDGSYATGCEANVTSDLANCGGCGVVCGAGDLCVRGGCYPMGPTGETCADAIPLRAGFNVLRWSATTRDYVPATAPCASSQASAGGDVVASFTATVDGRVEIALEKNNSQRHVIMASAVCGDLTGASCASALSGTTLTLSAAVTAGATYYFYFVDTASGSEPLPSPMFVNVREIPRSCTPGVGGVNGGAVTRIATSIPSATTEHYVVSDAALGGQVFVGGTSVLYRVPKSGGAAEAAHTVGMFGSSQLGYGLALRGDDLFSVESTSTGSPTSGLVFRLSQSAGASYLVEDAATFPTPPADDLRATWLEGTTLYVATHEFTVGGTTEIWAIDVSGGLPAAATLARTVVGESDCSGLTGDAGFFYLACSDGDRVVRASRAGTDVQLVTGFYDLNSTVNALHADDLDGDGLADVLYVQYGDEAVGYVCSPRGDAFPDVLVNWSGGTAATSNYGLGFDPVNRVLWAFDDDTRELIRIE